MATLKKQMATALLAGAWLAAVGSAAAFGYRGRPHVPPKSREPRVAVECPSAPSSSGQTAASVLGFTGESASERVLFVPSVTIAAPWPHREAGFTTRAP